MSDTSKRKAPAATERLRRRRRRVRITSVTAQIPNMLTVLALCAGLSSVRYALMERWEEAVVAVAVAAVLDALDGRMARLLKQTSKFGAELDSLSDFVAFGVAPGLVLFLWSVSELDPFGWIAVLIYATCMALRLARFNTATDDPDMPPFAYRFFVGVPAPAAAGIALLPILLSVTFEETWSKEPLLVAGWLVITALLMVSRLPTYSFKGTRLPQSLVMPLLVATGGVAMAMTVAPWQTLTGIVLAYVATIPISCRSYLRLKRLSASSPKAAEPEDPKSKD